MPGEPLESYGIDSMMIMQLNHQLAAVFRRAVEDACSSSTRRWKR